MRTKLDLERILKVKKDADHIINFTDPKDGFDARLKDPKNQIDKHGKGFNFEKRYNGTGDITIYYGAYAGYYGNSSVYSRFNVDEKDVFRECFIDVLNEMQDEILRRTANKMLSVCKESTDSIKDRIAELESQLKQIEQADEKD